MTRKSCAVLLFVFCVLFSMFSVYADDVTYTTKDGTWVPLGDNKYGMDKDGDGEYDIYLTQDGDDWYYDFVVYDDKAEYYVYENEVPGGYEVVGQGTDRDPVVATAGDLIANGVKFLAEITNETPGSVIERYDLVLEKDYAVGVLSLLGGGTADAGLSQSNQGDSLLGDGVAAGRTVVNTNMGAGGSSMVTVHNMVGPPFEFKITLTSDDPDIQRLISGEQMFGNVVFVDGVAEVTVCSGEGGRITVKDIPESVTYTIEELDSDGYTVNYTQKVDGVMDDSTKFEGSVLTGTLSGDVWWVCKNEDKPLSDVPRVDIKIAKVCENTEDSFDFQAVLFNLEPNQAYRCENLFAESSSGSHDGLDLLGRGMTIQHDFRSSAMVVADASGTGHATFSIKGGQYVILHDLPVGTEYQVMEMLADDSTYDVSYEITGQRVLKSSSGNSELTEKERVLEGDSPMVIFTNTVPPVDTEHMDISVRKVWGDTDEHAGITVYLEDDGDVLETALLDKYNNWQYVFENVDVYRGDGVTPREYEIREDNVSGYESVVNKISDTEYEITNTPFETVSLTISKEIKNYEDPNQSFNFTIKLDSDFNGVQKYIGSKAGSIRFVNGEASVSLKQDEHISIQGLPKGVSYTVSEANIHGYVPMEDKTGILDANKSVDFVNEYNADLIAEMPSTGGSGVFGIIALGSGLVLLSAVWFVYGKRRGRI